MFEIRLLATAEYEFAEAISWYDEQQNGLGDRFIAEIEKCFLRLQKDPFLFARKYSEDLRTAPLHVFPYLIIFWIDDEEKVVYVVSVFHMKRNPTR